MKCFHLERHCCIPLPSSTHVPAPLFDWTRYGRRCDWRKREHQALWRACGNLFLARLPAVTPLDMGDERSLALQLACAFPVLVFLELFQVTDVQKVKGVKWENADAAVPFCLGKTTCLAALLQCSQSCHSVHQSWGLGPWRFLVFTGYIPLFLHMLKVLQCRCIKIVLTFFLIETFVLWEHISKEM